MTAAVFFGVALWVNLKEPDLWPSQKGPGAVQYRGV